MAERSWVAERLPAGGGLCAASNNRPRIMSSPNRSSLVLLSGLIVLTLTANPTTVSAHPGRTASDGCHYCRTRCDYWGVPWNERHCHGGSPAPLPIIDPTPPTPKIAPLNERDVASAMVTEVIDGDTIRVRYSNGTIEKVRIIGMDTPESKDPRKPVECFANEATEHLKQLLRNPSVTLTRDVISGNRDSYRRLLRSVSFDPANLYDVAERMIRDGYAYAYTKYPFEQKMMDRYVDAQKEARENNRGLWAPSICETDPRVAAFRSTNTTTNQSTASGETKNANETKASSPESKSAQRGDTIFGLTLVAGIAVLGYITRPSTWKKR